MSPPPHLGNSHPTRSNSSSMQQISQHKRSLSFNHHLSYNQVQSMHPHPQQTAFMKPSSTPQHQLLSQRKEIVPISPSTKSAQSKSKNFHAILRFKLTSRLLLGNWSITNLRPSIPLRPCFTFASNSQSNTQLKFELSTKKAQPTYEEDALVLRVIEAYSIAFQNTSRNTVHSGESECSCFHHNFSCFPRKSSNHSSFKFSLSFPGLIHQ